jgi:Family of unknown function (DUF6353)
MDLKAIVKQGELYFRNHSPAILTGLGVTGVISTAYFAHETGFKTGMEHGYQTCTRDDRGLPGESYPTRKERFKEQWRLYIPPVVVGGVTIGCIVLGAKISNRRTAAITAAYSLSEKAFVEYKDKVKEKLGDNKEQKIRDDVAADKIRNNPLGKDVVLVGSGNVMCCEIQTMRYFLCDVETLKKAANEINDRVLRCEYATLAEFYTLIGQSPSPYSEEFGWFHARGLMEIEISPVLMNDTTPCIGFGFNYLANL